VKRVVFLSIIAAGLAFSAGTRIGFVDMKRIASGYYDLRDAKRELNSRVREWEAKRDSIRASLDSLENAFYKQLPMMTADEILRKQEEISLKRKEYNEYIRKIWGENGELEKYTKRLVDPYAERVKEVIAKIAAEMGYSAILDKSDEKILFVKAEDDLTQVVLDELNKGTVATAFGRKKTLAVVPFKELNADAHSAGLGGKIQSAIYNGFKGSSRFDVKDIKEINRAVQGQGIKSYENMSYNIAMNVAQAVSADYFVFGAVKLTGEQITLNVYLYRTSDGKKIVEQSSTFRNDDLEIATKCGELSHILTLKFKD